jgi:hypothetical protein
MIGKIQKAKRYAQERERFQFDSLSVTIAGENNSHRVTLADGKWACDCDFFRNRAVCTHTMALEELLKGMLPSPVAA